MVSRLTVAFEGHNARPPLFFPVRRPRSLPRGRAFLTFFLPPPKSSGLTICRLSLGNFFSPRLSSGYTASLTPCGFFLPPGLLTGVLKFAGPDPPTWADKRLQKTSEGGDVCS